MTTQADRADQWTRRAILDMVRESGGHISERPIYLGSSVSRPDAEPMAALGTIRHVEAAARHNARRYIRDAREAGHGWHDIGAAAGPDRRDRLRRNRGGGGLHLRGRGPGQCPRPQLWPVVHLDLPVV